MNSGRPYHKEGGEAQVPNLYADSIYQQAKPWELRAATKEIAMGLEDTHLDVLQNIEFAIVSVYCEKRDLRDYDVMRALDALIDVYRAEHRGHRPKEIRLPEPEQTIFERPKEMCELRLGRQGATGSLETEAPEIDTADGTLRGLRKVFRPVSNWLGWQEPTSRLEVTMPEVETVDVILACLRKIRRSVDRWNKRGDPQGYLQFVEQYVRLSRAYCQYESYMRAAIAGQAQLLSGQFQDGRFRMLP